MKGLFKTNMEDEKIIELFFERSENAITRTQEKYGAYMRTVAGNILVDEEDVSECVNDALLAVWNAIPPARPAIFRTYLAKIVRNIAISRWRKQSAQMRGSGRIAEALDELGDLSDDADAAEALVERLALSDIFSRYLRTLNKTERTVFIKRYWLFMTVREIAEELHLSESNVKVMLHRSRAGLKEQLIQEGFNYDK